MPLVTLLELIYSNSTNNSDELRLASFADNSTLGKAYLRASISESGDTGSNRRSELGARSEKEKPY